MKLNTVASLSVLNPPFWGRANLPSYPPSRLHSFHVHPYWAAPTCWRLQRVQTKLKTFSGSPRFSCGKRAIHTRNVLSRKKDVWKREGRKGSWGERKTYSGKGGTGILRTGTKPEGARWRRGGRRRATEMAAHPGAAEASSGPAEELGVPPGPVGNGEPVGIRFTWFLESRFWNLLQAEGLRLRSILQVAWTKKKKKSVITLRCFM